MGEKLQQGETQEGPVWSYLDTGKLEDTRKYLCKECVYSGKHTTKTSVPLWPQNSDIHMIM